MTSAPPPDPGSFVDSVELFVVQFAPPRTLASTPGTPAHFAAPPSDAVTTFVFMANLYAQEASGDSAASTSAERVLHRLRGSTESQTYIFGIATGQPPLAEVSDLHVPLIASTGDVPELDYVAFIHIHIPLLEETSTAEVEYVFDVNFLPLPGEELDAEAKALSHQVVAAGIRLARALGRTIIQTGTLHNAADAPEADPFTQAIARAGFSIKHAETQLLIPVPDPAPTPIIPRDLQVAVWVDYDIPEEHLDDVIHLLSVTSEDSLTGDLSVEPIAWTRARLAEAHARLRSRGAHVLLCVLLRHGRVIAMTELGRHAASDAEVAEWTITVTDRAHRRQGHATTVKLAALSLLHSYWPTITRTYSSVGNNDEAMQKINAVIGARALSSSEAWELVLPATT